MVRKMLKTIKCRGALFVEYALLLAFVTIMGIYFVNNRDFVNHFTIVFSKVEELITGHMTFAEKYPRNTVDNFIKFGTTLYSIGGPKYAEHDDEGKAKKRILEDTVYNSANMEIKLSQLSPDDKAKLTNIGLNLDDFPNATFYASDGRWYATWTNEDLSTKKQGETVKVITCSLSSTSDKRYYVGTTIYNDGSISNNRYDFANKAKPANYTYCATAEDAKKLYSKL